MIATFGKGGFIGSYLPDEFVGMQGDIRSAMPKEMEAEAVVNLACVQPARGYFFPVEYVATNVIGLVNILEWACCAGIPKALTCVTQKGTLTGEIGKLVITDHAALDLMAYFHNQYRLQTIVLRLPPVIGPGPYIAKSGLGQMIEGAKQGRIEVWGEPSNSRAVISVHDVVSAIQYLVRSDLQGVFSIGIPLSLESEVKAVQEVFGGELVYRPEIDNGIKQDIEVSGIPGWEPEWDFERMVRELKGAEK